MTARCAVRGAARRRRWGAVTGGIICAAASKFGRKGSTPHSFTGMTPVLLANATTKPISQVKVGDYVLTAEPGKKEKEKHRVEAVIVTKTDRDYVDVTVATKSGAKTIQTTKHHQFYEATRNTWTQAADLKAGQKLQNADGGLTRIINIRSYTATRITYDLTIDGLHTYYVEAGDTAVLVHNSNGCGPDNRTFATRSEARAAARARAGLSPDAVPDAVWTVGDDVTQRGIPGYRFDKNRGAHGVYEQFETEGGSRLIAEHTNDPNAPHPHFHAGQPKTDPSREGVNFGWDMTSEFERYSPVGGSHHMYYESSG